MAEEEPKKKTKGSPSERDRRKEYYLVSALSGTLSASQETWLVDTGASRHMTGYKSTLSDFRKKPFLVQVELGNNASYDIKGVGSTSFLLDLGTVLHINDILYVPGLKRNLLSVGVLEDKGYEVIFK